jgi:hypothetical protein
LPLSAIFWPNEVPEVLKMLSVSAVLSVALWPVRRKGRKEKGGKREEKKREKGKKRREKKGRKEERKRKK